MTVTRLITTVEQKPVTCEAWIPCARHTASVLRYAQYVFTNTMINIVTASMYASGVSVCVLNTQRSVKNA